MERSNQDSPPPRKSSGICYLVGSGPGDPGLLTLRAKQCIEEADVVAYDYLSGSDLLCYARPDAETIYVGKKAKDHTLPQEDINALLAEHVAAGKVVTRVKGGDPIIFGRGGEEAEYLHERGLKFEIVPGISSSIAGPAYAGIPVTHRAFVSQFTVFTGHEDPTKAESSLDFKKLAQADGTKVMLMGVQRLREICATFMEEGMSPDLPVALVRWATTNRQQTITGTVATIADIAEEKQFKAPAVAVFGEVVSLRDQLNWFENRPLFGKRIVVTRTRKQASVLSDKLRRLGADAFEIPTIRIQKPDDLLGFGAMVQDSHTYDWIVFTSPNGVEAFFEMFYKIYKDAREIGGARIAAIGPGTAKKIAEYHLTTDLIPEKYVAEGLVESLMKEESVENLTFLWVRAQEARDVVAAALTGAGAIVDEAVAYQTVMETEDINGARQRLAEEGADVITFTSASTAENFFKLGLPLPEGVKIASIGPVTSKAIIQHGHAVDIEASQHDIPGLVDAIVEYFESK
jgi:uroporphyrinogen III methyltransferase / synthase